MKAIFQRELKSYFGNMTAFAFIALMLFVSGLFSTQYNFKDGYPSFAIILYGVSFIFLALIPLLTMKSFANERQEKTETLLYSLPIKISSVVMGKYLAMLLIYTLALLVMCVYPLILSSFGEVNFVLDYSTILAFFLLGAALIAIGMFVSSLSSNQMISAVVTFSILLIVYLLPDIASLLPKSSFVSALGFGLIAVFVGVMIYYMTGSFYGAAIPVLAIEIVIFALYFFNEEIFSGLLNSLLKQLSLFSLLTPFIEGLFDIGGLFFYLSVAVVFVFLTRLALEKKRYN